MEAQVMKTGIHIHTNLVIEPECFTPTVCCIMLPIIPETLTEDILCALHCAAHTIRDRKFPPQRTLRPARKVSKYR